MPRSAMLLLAMIITIAGCQRYVPTNLPLQLNESLSGEEASYEDELGRTIGSADANGPEYRMTLQDGARFFMKSPRIRGDSVVGYYRPRKDTEWARAAVLLYDVRMVEEQKVDWLATMSLLTVPITLALLLTY